MKKKLVTMLCCILVINSFAACGNTQPKNEASQATGDTTEVQDTLADITESEPASEETVESTASETVESQPSSEVNEENNTEDKEPMTYRVELTDIGDNKVLLIKTYRLLTGLELKEAKDTIDSAPCILLETTNGEEANLYKTSLEGCGATVVIHEESIDPSVQTSEETSQAYYVKLLSVGDNQEKVIEVFMDITNMELLPTTTLIESVPCLVYQTTDLEKANALVSALTEAGATIDENMTDSAISKDNEQATPQEISGAKFAVDSVFSITGAGTVLTGKVEQGSIKLGDSAVIVLEDGTEIPVTINRIEVFGGLLEVAEEGKNVSLGFEEEITKDSVLTAVSVVVAAE